MRTSDGSPRDGVELHRPGAENDGHLGRVSALEESCFRRWDLVPWEDQPDARAFALAAATDLDALADDTGRWTGLSGHHEPFRQLSLDGPSGDERVLERREHLERLQAELAERQCMA